MSVNNAPYLALIIGSVLAFTCVFLTCMLVPLWFGSQRIYEIVRQGNHAALTDDPDKARAMVRGLPSVGLGLWGLTGGIGVVAYDTLAVGNGTAPSDGAAYAGGAGLFALLLGLLFDWTIVRFNQPKFLVPPHLRGEPGFNEVLRQREQRGEQDSGGEGRAIA